MKIIFCFILSACISILYSQNNYEEPLARIGSITITAEEFQQRYEMTPSFKKQSKGKNENAKLDFLFTIIAEKLWAMEAGNLGYDRSEVIEFSEEAFEKMFVRDALYHQEIKNKVHISEEEFIEGYLRSTQKLYVNFLFSEDKDEINDLYNFLEQGFPFDTILAESPELSEQEKPVEIVFGQVKKILEDSLYNLKLNEYTSPILTEDGWYIFRLSNKVETRLLTAREREDARNTVKKTIEARKENELYINFYRKFFVDKKINADGMLVKDLTIRLSELLTTKKKNLEISNESVYLTSADFSKLKTDFSEEVLRSDFIDFNFKQVTLKEFINQLAFEGLNSEETDAESVFRLVNNRVRKFIEDELLAEEGYRRNLDKLPGVQSQMEIWKENYMYQLMKSNYLDSINVTEEEALEYYHARNSEEDYPLLVNIIEILTDSLSTLEKIITEIEEGKDIRKLALKYTKRNWVKEKNGEFGLFPSYKYGEIGRIAGTMDIGEIYGPLKVPEGYSLFKLIDKQEEKSTPPEPFEKLKDNYIENLSFKKAELMMINKTAELAIKYGISINEEILKNIEVTNINAFGFRYLGFGGRITAAPLIAPYTGWVEKWIKKMDVIQ